MPLSLEDFETSILTLSTIKNKKIPSIFYSNFNHKKTNNNITIISYIEKIYIYKNKLHIDLKIDYETKILKNLIIDKNGKSIPIHDYIKQNEKETYEIDINEQLFSNIYGNEYLYNFIGSIFFYICVYNRKNQIIYIDKKTFNIIYDFYKKSILNELEKSDKNYHEILTLRESLQKEFNEKLVISNSLYKKINNIFCYKKKRKKEKYSALKDEQHLLFNCIQRIDKNLEEYKTFEDVETFFNYFFILLKKYKVQVLDNEKNNKNDFVILFG